MIGKFDGFYILECNKEAFAFRMQTTATSRIFNGDIGFELAASCLFVIILYIACNPMFCY